jgi:hypothetical protein
MWALLRRKDVFGGDADVFRPERWLEANPEELQEMETVSELVWGYGKYVCLGKSVALIELNKIFIEVSQNCGAYFTNLDSSGGEADRFEQLLRNFDWKLVDPTKPMKSACYGIFVMSDFWVIVTERSTRTLK